VDFLDTPQWGAKALGRVANLLDGDGEVNEKQAFYLCKKLRARGVIQKVDGRYSFTPRAVLGALGAKLASSAPPRLEDNASGEHPTDVLFGLISRVIELEHGVESLQVRLHRLERTGRKHASREAGVAMDSA
jgi:hypothetical protein